MIPLKYGFDRAFYEYLATIVLAESHPTISGNGMTMSQSKVEDRKYARGGTEQTRAFARVERRLVPRITFANGSRENSRSIPSQNSAEL